MPSFVSLNHQAAPSWILPGMPPPWKAPMIAASTSLSLGFREYRIVLGSACCRLQRVEQSNHRRGKRRIIHGIVTSIRPKFGKHPCVVVTGRINVELHHPAPICIQFAKERQRYRLVLVLFLTSYLLTRKYLCKDGGTSSRVATP